MKKFPPDICFDDQPRCNPRWKHGISRSFPVPCNFAGQTSASCQVDAIDRDGLGCDGSPVHSKLPATTSAVKSGTVGPNVTYLVRLHSKAGHADESDDVYRIVLAVREIRPRSPARNKRLSKTDQTDQTLASAIGWTLANVIGGQLGTIRFTGQFLEIRWPNVNGLFIAEQT